jgi:hypothetical protein
MHTITKTITTITIATIATITFKDKKINPRRTLVHRPAHA